MLRPPSEDVKKSLEAATVMYERNVAQIQPFLGGRGINPDTSVSFRLGLVGVSPDLTFPGHEHMAGKLAIPSIGPRGVQAIRFRCLTNHDCHEVGCPKYLGLAGVPTKLFNLRVVATAGDTLAICEGELDAIILNQVGIPAVGVVGANNWKTHYARIFGGFNDLIIVGDNDDAGRSFTRKLLKELPHAREIIPGVVADDVTSFYCREGEDALLDLLT